MDQAPVKERSVGDSSPRNLAFLRLAFDIGESIVLGLKDRLVFSWSVIRIAVPPVVSSVPVL